ncbi:hypothetical protein DMH12_24870 [Streptomyces sp. WAC 04229]|uniref:HNH endonuclease n=1 Tax=Streptomyces sp. WAC 04229 TaxID=2203206 RepID=UPI000F73EB21|nr:HNH endonuclease [Streptomyces sp. WAC 04229]RSN50518.1 hypothetical protein DMH12_24870 [Streptomyces sp. WAC 04229]
MPKRVHRSPEPSGCRWCGVTKADHMQRWSSAVLDDEINAGSTRTLDDLPDYVIYGDGRVQGPSGKFLSLSPNSNGYMTFSGPRQRPRNQKNYRVHVVVCRAFHGEKPLASHQVRHLNGDKSDNAAWNLAWGTPGQNSSDRDEHGRTLYGLKNPAGKISEDQVRAIKVRYATGRFTQKQVADTFSVSRSLVGQIVRGEIHRPRVAGWHQWEQPTQQQIKDRMRARRAERSRL